MEVLGAFVMLGLAMAGFVIVIAMIMLPLLFSVLVAVTTIYLLIALPESLIHYAIKRKWRLLHYEQIFPYTTFGGRSRWGR